MGYKEDAGVTVAIVASSAAVPQRIARFAWSARHALTISLGAPEMLLREAMRIACRQPRQHLDGGDHRFGVEPAVDLATVWIEFTRL